MADALINHQLGQLGFILAILVILVTNLAVLKRIGGDSSTPPGKGGPRVSVLLPARNEEAHIRACVESLLEQDYPEYEVVVLNDSSQDNTGKILGELSLSSDRLVVLEGKEIPSGWNGKNWACHQLSQAAKGEVLLFTDADTYHHPQVITQAIQQMLVNGYDFITLFPYQEVKTFGEKLLVPSLYWCIYSFFPLVLAYRLPFPFLSTAIGQFLMVRRMAYEAAGGHIAIRSEIADDLALARRIKSRGYRWRAFDGTQMVRCRMYKNFGEAFSGFTKNLFAAFGNRIIPFLFVWIWIAIVFLEPHLLLVARLLNAPIPADSLLLAACSIALALILWGLTLWRFRFPIWTVVLYPLMVLLIEAVAFKSLFASLHGQATWKGRQLGRQKTSWW